MVCPADLMCPGLCTEIVPYPGLFPVADQNNENYIFKTICAPLLPLLFDLLADRVNI